MNTTEQNDGPLEDAMVRLVPPKGCIPSFVSGVFVNIVSKYGFNRSELDSVRVSGVSAFSPEHKREVCVDIVLTISNWKEQRIQELRDVLSGSKFPPRPFLPTLDDAVDVGVERLGYTSDTEGEKAAA